MKMKQLKQIKMSQTKKYKSFLNKSQEEIDKDELSYKVEEGELQLQADLLATKKSLSVAKRELESAKGQFPFDVAGILKAEDLISDIETTIERMESLKKEMF